PIEAPAPVLPEAVDARAELRAAVHELALTSELHMKLLVRFVKEGGETPLGRPELQKDVGGAAGAVASALDDFLQAKIVKRRRSPRVRGGSGFLYSASPRMRNVLGRLVRHFEEPASRAEVLSWVQQESASSK